jgi:hypothetical protein
LESQKSRHSNGNRHKQATGGVSIESAIGGEDVCPPVRPATPLLVGTLAAAELILRIVDLRELRDGYREGSPVIFRYDSELGWLPVAKAVATFTDSQTITVRSNSFGLRDVEHDRSARPTVMFIGDSFVWGYDVEASERFTELLRDNFPEVRIVNAGVNAYGTDQEYLLLRRLWSEYNPNVVVLMFCVDNDRQDNTTKERSGNY